MDDQQPEEHWRPGQPWTPRQKSDVAVGRPPGETPRIDAVEEPIVEEPSEPEQPPVTYRDAETRMMSRPPVDETVADETSAAPPAAPEPAPVHDSTVMMPRIEQQPPPPPPPPPVSPTETRMSAPPSAPPRERKAGKRRGRFLRRLLLLVFVLAAIVALGLVWVEGQFNRVETPSVAGSGASTYLIVGSDSRENLPDDLDGKFGSFAGERADVIILAQVVDGRVQMLSLPRDLKVEIPGRGTDKINAAYAYGGADLLIQTIQSDLGIPVSHYLDVEFGGFAEIVDAVGGVELTFDNPTRDLKTGLDVGAGTQEVDGATALAYVRSRSTEELVDGNWQGADGGDIARTGRQREVLEGVIAKAVNPAGLLRLPGLASAVTDSVRVGESTHSWNLGWFGTRFVFASESESMSLPVVIASEGGVSYVVRTDEAIPVIQAFVSGLPLPLPEPEE